ncbi:hypothetical protein NP493_1328g00013 [Ridgeia piscesae]|uniref:Uncharacterized protein n=1 Tax=Ridgeia piscesae TaxID=27915 RepID=A0AAD9K8G4_RIDPI|nr:hypothetical protein NP493_1328g00013 [Ridgeia piscesae]
MYTLAIQELDIEVGKVMFRTRDGILQMTTKSGIRGLQAALMCQMVHKNGLIGAVQQMHLCQPFMSLGDVAKSTVK